MPDNNHVSPYVCMREYVVAMPMTNYVLDAKASLNRVQFSDNFSQLDYFAIEFRVQGSLRLDETYWSRFVANQGSLWMLVFYCVACSKQPVYLSQNGIPYKCIAGGIVELYEESLRPIELIGDAIWRMMLVRLT